MHRVIPIARPLFATLVVLLVGVGSVPAQRPPWLGENYRRPAVYGRVVDSIHGTPVGGLGIQSYAMLGAAFTDSAGWFVLSGLNPGAVTIFFRCPTERRLLFARRFGAQELSIASTTDTNVTFHVPMHQCVEPPIAESTGTFVGTYEAEFERFEFFPCRPFPTFPGTAYEGLAPRISVSLSERLRETGVAWPETGDLRTRSYFVRWHGTISGPGGYGHLSQSLYGLVVDSIISIESGTNAKCPP